MVLKVLEAVFFTVIVVIGATVLVDKFRRSKTITVATTSIFTLSILLAGTLYSLHTVVQESRAFAASAPTARESSRLLAFLKPLASKANAHFCPNEDWTHGPYFGSMGTFFADVTGDGKADAIVVNNNTVTVRRSTGHSFGPNEDWTNGAYFGSRGTFFADVTGDGKADAIVINNNTVIVRRSTGRSFGPNEDWTNGPYFGSMGTFFADVTGDGKADAIVVNNNTVTVRRSC